MGEDPLTLAKLTRPFKPQLWRRAKVKDCDILTKRPESDEFHAGQKVYVQVGQGEMRPAEIVCEVRYTVRLPRTRQVVSKESVAHDVDALLKKGEMAPLSTATSPPKAQSMMQKTQSMLSPLSRPKTGLTKGEMVYARFAENMAPQRSRIVELREDGRVDVSFQNVDVVVERAAITLRHQPGSTVTIREPGCFLERSEAL